MDNAAGGSPPPSEQRHHTRQVLRSYLVLALCLAAALPVGCFGGQYLGRLLHPPAPDAPPHMVISTTTKTSPQTEGGAAAHFTFDVHNTGKGPLHIKAVETSCFCTVASFDHLIPAGGVGRVTANVQTDPLWAAHIEKELTVLSDDPLYPSQSLTMIVQTTPAVSIFPDSYAELSYGDAHKPLSQIFMLEVNRKGYLNPNRPQAAQRPPIPPGARLTAARIPGDREIYRVVLALSPPAEGGALTATGILPTVAGPEHPLRLTVNATWRQHPAIIPSIASFGVIPSQGTGRASVTLTSTSSALRIPKAESDDPALSVHIVPPPGPGSPFQLQLTYHGGWKSGVHHGIISVHTLSPQPWLVNVPYWADVK